MRPRLIDGWRKSLPPAQSIVAPAHEKLRVEVLVAPIASLLRATSAFALLTDADRISFQRLRAPAARHSAIAARILLRLGLSRAVKRSVSPRDWNFEKNTYGKPAVTNPFPPVNFSVSHVDALAAVAVAPELNIGVDVEAIDQAPDAAVIADFLHANERLALDRLPPQWRANEFIRLWTRKEAYSKLIGLGHSIDFASIDCRDENRPRFPTAPHRLACLESFHLLVCRSVFQASLAIGAMPYAAAIEIQLIDVRGPGDVADDSSHASAIDDLAA